MELYVLDSLLRRSEVIDRFNSLIWTERFATAGDFELEIPQTPSTAAVRALLVAGQQLALNESNRVMTIESIESDTADDGTKVITYKGPSLENFFAERPAMSTLAGPTWTLTDTPGNIMRTLFNTICVTGALSTADILPYYSTGNLYPNDTIPAPSGTISLTISPGDLYSVLAQIAADYGLGFRLTRNGDASQIFFNVYSGSDRTTHQTTLPSVIFDPNLENILDSSYVQDITSYKNVAYVVAPNGHQTVFASGASAVTGFSRRALFVDASDITTVAGTALDAALLQRGTEALAALQSQYVVDGEVSQYSSYKYGIDYNLGDLVTLRDENGFTNDMTVTEQIFVSDSSGERSYPTLQTAGFITPNSWYSSLGALHWSDATQHWADV